MALQTVLQTMARSALDRRKFQEQLQWMVRTLPHVVFACAVVRVCCRLFAVFAVLLVMVWMRTRDSSDLIVEACGFI